MEALGPGTVGFEPGDRVVVPHHVACGTCDLCRRGSETLCPLFRENLLVPGGFSEHILVRERAVRLATFGLPPHVPDEAAVFLEPAACVLRGIRQSRLLEMPAALPALAAIVGGGSMGLLHLLVLKAVRPGLRVAVSDPLEERLELALRAGRRGRGPARVSPGTRSTPSPRASARMWSSTRPADPRRSPRLSASSVPGARWCCSLTPERASGPGSTSTPSSRARGS